MLTDKPYVSMPLPESRDAVVACENCCKPLGTRQCKQRIYLAGPRLSSHLPKKRLRSRMMCLANAIVVHAIAVKHARIWLHLPMHSAVAEARRPPTRS